MKKTISRKDWNQLHSDYKGITNGKPHILQLDDNGATVSTPITITK